jgi:hypothetical protein
MHIGAAKGHPGVDTNPFTDERFRVDNDPNAPVVEQKAFANDHPERDFHSQEFQHPISHTA